MLHVSQQSMCSASTHRCICSAGQWCAAMSPKNGSSRLPDPITSTWPCCFSSSFSPHCLLCTPLSQFHHLLTVVLSGSLHFTSIFCNCCNELLPYITVNDAVMKKCLYNKHQHLICWVFNCDVFLIVDNSWSGNPWKLTNSLKSFIWGVEQKNLLSNSMKKNIITAALKKNYSDGVEQWPIVFERDGF